MSDLSDLMPFAFALFAIISTAWSGLPEATLRLGATLFLLTSVSFKLVRKLSPEVTIVTVAIAFRLLLLSSVAVAAVRPDIGLVVGDYQSGALKGVFNHRNFLAFASVLALLTSFVCARIVGRRKIVVFDALLAAGCLIAAQSQTSLITAAVTGLFMAAIWIFGRGGVFLRTLLWTGFIGFSATIIWLALTYMTTVTQGLGRDTTLTGRTDVWEAVLEEIPRHLSVGAGWNAVWHEGLPIANRMWSAAGFQMFHAHDGYLDVILQVGLVGLALYMSVVLLGLLRAVRFALPGASSGYHWCAAVILALVIGNITESQFSTVLGWLMLTLAFYCSNRDLANRRDDSVLVSPDPAASNWTERRQPSE